MKIKLLMGLFLTFCAGGFAQTEFEEGYIINKDGNKTQVLILNEMWKRNPTIIKYKESQNSETKEASVNEITEFRIGDHAKYISYELTLEHYLQNNLHPTEPKTGPVLLKTLLEGDANLYKYSSPEGNLYFFTNPLSSLKQLIFPKDPNKENDLPANIELQRQLWEELKCEDMTMSELVRVEYKEKHLVKYFTKYNSCMNSEFTKYEQRDESWKFNLWIRPGYYFSTYRIEVSNYGFFDDQQSGGFRLGAEAEVILPILKNKLSLFIEPTYMAATFFKTTSDNFGSSSFIAEVDYKSIRIPLGARFHHYFNKENILYVNAAAVQLINLGSQVKVYRESPVTGSVDQLAVVDIDAKVNLTLGVGYKWKRFSAEFRYEKNPNITDGTAFIATGYSSLSAIIGYRLF